MCVCVITLLAAALADNLSVARLPILIIVSAVVMVTQILTSLTECVMSIIKSKAEDWRVCVSAFELIIRVSL